MTNKKHKTGSQGFTLIELLIVVALLGALAALVLPSMSANRTKAMEATCDYNQVSTIKTLNDHYALNGALPDMLHTGLKADVDTIGDANDLMGVPGEDAVDGNTLDNMLHNATVGCFSDEELASLKAACLENVVYGDGSVEVALTTSAGHVLFLNDEDSSDPYLSDDPANITFNGHGVKWWNGTDAGGAAGRVFMTFISPITDWTTSGDNDWGKGLDSTVSVKKAGECKVPTDSDFNYYIAYIKAFSAQVDNETVPAILVGTSCPECGVTNP